MVSMVMAVWTPSHHHLGLSLQEHHGWELRILLLVRFVFSQAREKTAITRDFFYLQASAAHGKRLLVLLPA